MTWIQPALGAAFLLTQAKKLPGTKPKDITGQKFGSLTAIRRVSPIGTVHTKWLFVCDCGVEVVTYKHHATSGRIKQCLACGHKRQTKAITKHGMARTKEYRRYVAAKQRCTNPRCKRYACYGGRGIEFRFESFEQFFAELGVCPPNKTLDRIDNDGHYEPGNVRWATKAQQYASRRPWKTILTSIERS